MQRAGVPFSPAEAHAIAIGLLSGAVAQPNSLWQAEVYAELDADNPFAEECRNLLDQVYAVAQPQMDDEAFALQLFLPEQDQEGYSVNMGLRDWAQGFLFGLGLAGDTLTTALSAESQEALRDFYAIAQLDVQGSPSPEEDGQAQVEIEEYMRVGALLIHTDIQQQMVARHD